MDKKIVAAIVSYAVFASLTGGYYFNHRCERGAYNQCGLDSFIAGTYWPGYWLARFGLEVTK